MKGDEVTPPDDLEGLGYTLAWLACGKLPWSHLKDKQFMEIFKMKKAKPNYCADLPRAVVDLIADARLREPNAHVDYSHLKDMFCKALEKLDHLYSKCPKTTPPS